MGKYANEDWYRKCLADYTARYGAVPPPWVYAPTSHPYSIRWRMGGGETLLMVFWEWWEQQNWCEDERAAYFKKWPPPPRWIPWMADQIWDLNPWEGEGEFDYSAYFERLDQFGFKGMEDVQRDLDDEQWLEAESRPE